ncbi:MAG TPA: response regulator [Acidobacteriota bacterium]|jgi:DNA-binding response OmpR family regulator
MAFHILVVDDDADVRDMLTRFLKRRGYAVDQAADGEEALRSLRNRDPDLMLLDIYLPKKTGLEVLREMKDAGLRVRTIALSAMPDDQIVASSLSLGAVSFMAKPFDFMDLTAQIDANLVASLDA